MFRLCALDFLKALKRDKKMKNYRSKKISTSAYSLASAFIVAAAILPISDVKSEENSNFKYKGAWLVGLKVLNLNPDVKSVTSIGGEAQVAADTVPELDIRYFLTDNIAIETILGYTEHRVSATGTELGEVNLGSTKVLPPTITLQYHFTGGRRFLPYVGVGLNYTVYFDSDPGDTVDVSYKDDFGFALNLGFDYVINERSYFNVDLKKYKLSTDTVIDAGDAGIATASVDLDPLAISVGFGWKF